MAAHPYHNTPRALHATNSRASRPDQLETGTARGDIHDSRAVQLVDQSSAYRQYTPLKISMEELYERIEGRGLLYPPASITKPAHRRDKGRFCKFHDTYGHTISQCRDLKIQVEDLVRNRYLDEYVDGVSPVIESEYTRDEGVERGLKREQPAIRVIAGGPTLAGDSNRARKNYGRYAMTGKEAKVVGTELQRILVDTGSSVDILFKSALDNMGISDLKLERTNTSLKGFGGGRLTPIGVIELLITVGTKPFERTMMLDFVVVEERSPYQMILGRPFMRISQCVMSTHYLALKYIINGVVGVVKGDQRMARSCYATAAKETLQVTSLDNRGDSKNGRQELVEKLEEVVVSRNDPSRVVKVGSELGEAIKGELVKCLQSHADIFAWSHEDMSGINRGVACHKLAVKKGPRPVRQKMRCFNQERYEAINTEVEKLLKAGFIREAKYPEWISNVVLVKKANGKWRMCVDFTDLNKACPKDSFPLPKIDQLVDSTAGHSLLSFMDAFSGYNQIPMDEQDEESTTFITNMGLFCYRVMSFGLKNAGATYQRLVNKVFKPLISHTMEVYVDDMITKSREPKEHVKHLEETFELLRRYEMKLNPEKCAFGVSSGKFLGYLVSHRGIETNPKKIRVVIEMRSPRTVKEVQSLTGKLAALNRFISRATDKCHPFFQIIKKGKKMEWTPECEEAFGQLKEYLALAPLLSTPREGDQLLLYLAISKRATSSVLVREEEGKQHPVYYTSKALVDAETRYPLMEKWALALITAARKLRPYFQAHQIVVLTDQPLRQVLQKPDASGRLVKWSVELSEFDLSYRLRGAIKAQALADFMVDRAGPGGEGSGAGVIIRSPEGVEVSYAVKFEFQLTNNQAEYEAFITGLGLAHALRAERVEIRADSQLVCNQLSDQFQARGEKMGLYLKKAKQMVGLFQEVEIKQISRNENYRADMLARMAAITDPKLPKSVPLEVRISPSIGEEVEVMRVSTRESWMDLIRAYVRDGVLPEDKRQARKLKCRAARYTLLDEVLYRRGFTLPLLRCVDDEEADYVLREIHEGICGNHSGARTLAFKALRQGYFWPTMHQDAKTMAKNCKTCQSFSEVPVQPPEKLTTMTSPWPFVQWGIDLIGPLPKGRGAATHAIVAIDYFTKWVEVGVLSQITERKTTDFIWKNIICRYGIPYAIITDNGRQFDNSNFREFCRNLGVDLKFCTPAHPQANGQVEAANKVIKKLLKIRLGEKKGAWVDELPGVLWAYRTTHKTATGETPFALAFGHEAVVPAEIGVGTHRTEYFAEEENDEQICLSLDLLEEKREGASQKVAQCQQRVTRYYNKNVRVRQFRAGDWVLRKVNQNTRDPNYGALGPRWEGPYRVIRATGPGAYELAYPDGRNVKRSWNAEHLKKYFQ
ncbi:Ribonuclease H [Citrus sinensis]|uniref:Ribonuclease H n=1 Tax=Citrus sinensis TaxID=2711 RepID=A0ACB8NY82_CITSI|nr:Ribonuclease H [Citrus sinensis]